MHGRKQVRVVCMVRSCITISVQKQDSVYLFCEGKLIGYSRAKVAALVFNTSSSSEPTSSVLGYSILLVTWANSFAALCDNYFFPSVNEVLPFSVQNTSESVS